MGCGVSRPLMMNADATKSQPGLLPIRRRIEEIRRAKLRSLVRRSKSQLSTRDLLGQDDDHLTELESLQDDGRKSVSSRPEVQEIPVMEKMKRDDNDIVENKETSPVVVEKMKRNDSVQNKEINPVVVEKMKRNDSVQNKEISPVDDNHDQKHEEKQKEDNVVEEELGNRLGEGPGSPSFREYCTFPSSDDEEDGTTKEAECKTEEENGDEIRRESTDSSEGSVDELVHKKERKGRRFRRVLPKGGQAVVKNLLNVTGCYCSNPLHHTNTRPLEPVPTS